MRIFRDSVTPEAITLIGTAGVLAYVNGSFAWPAVEVARFTKNGYIVARIDVNGSAPQKASILDVERFDATPAHAPAWIQARDSFRPGTATIYCSRDAVEAVVAAAEGLRYWLLVADWTGQPHNLQLELPPGVKIAGVQYAHLTNYDSSAIYADGWHRK